MNFTLSRGDAPTCCGRGQLSACGDLRTAAETTLLFEHATQSARSISVTGTRKVMIEMDSDSLAFGDC